MTDAKQQTPETLHREEGVKTGWRSRPPMLSASHNLGNGQTVTFEIVPLFDEEDPLREAWQLFAALNGHERTATVTLDSIEDCEREAPATLARLQRIAEGHRAARQAQGTQIRKFLTSRNRQ